MRLNFASIMTIFSIVSIWATQALADGKVTLAEALTLVSQLAAALGLPTEFDTSKLTDTQNVSKED